MDDDSLRSCDEVTLMWNGWRWVGMQWMEMGNGWRWVGMQWMEMGNGCGGDDCAQKLNVILPMSLESFFISGPSKTSSGMIPK